MSTSDSFAPDSFLPDPFLPECRICQFYSCNLYLRCAVRPSGVQEHCPDFLPVNVQQEGLTSVHLKTSNTTAQTQIQ